MFFLGFYVPKSHLEQVKQALFNAGAGKIGNYKECCWQTQGEGQFMPLTDSQPFIGEQNQLEIVSEYKIELVCDASIIKNVITALKQAHPYEQPDYHVFKMEDF